MEGFSVRTKGGGWGPASVGRPAERSRNQGNSAILTGSDPSYNENASRGEKGRVRLSPVGRANPTTRGGRSRSIKGLEDDPSALVSEETQRGFATTRSGCYSLLRA